MRDETRPQLGDRVADAISGYTGIVVGITDWLYGCRRVGVQSEKTNKDGKRTEPEWFDEGQLTVAFRGAVAVPAYIARRESTGGPNRHEERR